MTTIEHIVWPTWGALILLSLALGATLGSIIHERRKTRSFAVVVIVAALIYVTVSTWR